MQDFSKTFLAILSSSLWDESLAVRVVFLTMTLLRDLDEEVRGTHESIARAANVPLKATKRAIKLLESPDPRSRSQEEEGRRLIPIPGGWRVVNGAYYRNLMSLEDRREKQRVRTARFRAKQRNAPVTPCNAGDDMRGEERRGEEREGGVTPPPPPWRFPLHCREHADCECPPKCGACKERREMWERGDLSIEGVPSASTFRKNGKRQDPEARPRSTSAPIHPRTCACAGTAFIEVEDDQGRKSMAPCRAPHQQPKGE